MKPAKIAKSKTSSSKIDSSKTVFSDKIVVFDSGPIISLTTNNLLFILALLKKNFKGRFCITEEVKNELVTKPLTIKKFEFEALQVMRLIEEGTLEVVKADNTLQLMEITNSSFNCKDYPMRLTQIGEISSIKYAIDNNAQTVVIDERTTRLMIEDPECLLRVLRKKMNCNVQSNSKRIKEFSELTKNLRVIRSSELVAAAYTFGILDDFKTNKIPNSSERLIEGTLWGVKLNGCSITEEEINEISEIVNGK